MTALRIYSCAITLAVWALSWWAGLRDDLAVGLFLGLTAITVVLAETARRR